MKLNLKLKTILSIVVFLLVFIALILVATFCDFQISGIMTKGILPEGEYFATDFFGVMLESVGCLPIYLTAAFILCVLFWCCLKLWKKKPFNIICAVVCGIGVVVACWIGLKDSIGYIFEHTLARTGDISGNLAALDKFEHSAAVYGVEVVFALIMGALAILATMHFKPETLKKLLWFSIATVGALLLANLLIMIIKDPVGRMRFRAIQSDLGAKLIEDGKVAGFTEWYKANGQPSQNVLNSFLNTYGVKDAFKSFPSGHTCSAGSVYALIMIPTLFGFKEKNKKGATLACWIVPIVYTALVAVSRIMVGAHYMSDVTFGGTLAFVSFVIMWEIFICRGSHFFALFPRLKKQTANNAPETEDGQVGGEVADDEIQPVLNDAQSVEEAETQKNTEAETVEENSVNDMSEDNPDNGDNPTSEE